MKKILLIFLILGLVFGQANAISLIGSGIAPAGGSTVVLIGATTCGASACDYGTISSNYLDPGSGDTNWISAGSFKVDGNEGIAILYLNTSSIPSGKTITDVSLFLYIEFVDSVPDGTITGHRMLSYPGGPSAVDLSDVSYNEKEMTENVQWGGNTQARPLSGTDYSATALFSMSASSFTESAFNEINTSGLTTLVQGWYGGSITNQGIIIFNSNDYSAIIAAAHNSSTASRRFYWEITYSD